MDDAAAAGRLLILDDEPTVAQVLGAMARVCGVDSRHAATVEAFLAAAADWAPTHVAIDLMLPGAHGEDVLRQLAATGCPARVLVCSGAGPAELQAALATAQALGLPVAGVLAKPFTLAALRALLRPR
ncbi:response regulator [Piscinibacter sakaiensis]|uniref:Response regulator n=1 Tax=Piscinibacter sakaiensis TaxID=1547922 RepID=A0A0K8P1R9_PISS1|nr:response regulator [Piscinibacter sakaiensis]GAP36484.1 response regulator [Piscinibacter sakaiensis]